MCANDKLVIAAVCTDQHLWGTQTLIKQSREWMETVPCNTSSKGEVWAMITFGESDVIGVLEKGNKAEPLIGRAWHWPQLS